MQTIKRPVSGIGIHTSSKVNMTRKPALVDQVI
jgi:UDP-3-O-acyl-N-acetylglucosamine deacetylase